MTHYDTSFYKRQMDQSKAGAEAIAPILLDLFKISSIVDVGCGVGTWLETFERHGVHSTLGLDGDYVDRQLLKISADRFKAHDISKPFDVGRFDLAICMEVAEHIPEDKEEHLIDSLVATSDVIGFSAAIPWQGGVAHVNEKWQAHWAQHFATRGYVAVDCLRPSIWQKTHLPYYYRQNALVYCRPEKVPKGFSKIEPTDIYLLNHIAPDFYQSRSELMQRYMPPPRSMRAVLGAIAWSITSYMNKSKIPRTK